MTLPALVLPPPLLDRLRSEAEAAYPSECCGLLVGRREGEIIAVTGAEPSPNLLSHTRDRFEIDVGLRIRVMRRLRGGPDAIVGHYHSHPDHPAVPSGHDLAMAFEPDLAWLIIAVDGGRAVDAGAFRPTPDRGRFDRFRLPI